MQKIKNFDYIIWNYHGSFTLWVYPSPSSVITPMIRKKTLGIADVDDVKT